MNKWFQENVDNWPAQFWKWLEIIMCNHGISSVLSDVSWV